MIDMNSIILFINQWTTLCLNQKLTQYYHNDSTVPKWINTECDNTKIWEKGMFSLTSPSVTAYQQTTHTKNLFPGKVFNAQNYI